MGYFDDLIPTGKGGLFDDLVPVPASSPSMPQDFGAEAPALSGRPRAAVPFDAPVTMPVEPLAPTGFADLIPRGVAAPQMSPNEVGRPVGDLPAFGPMGGVAPNDWARQEIARLEAQRGADAGQPVNDPFAQEGMTDLLARRGQQFVQQLGQFVGDAISSEATRSAVSERSISDDAGGYVNQAMEQLRLVDEKLNSGAKFSEAERAQIMDVRRQALQTISQYSQMAPGSDLAKGILNAEDRPAMSAGQKVAEAITQTVGAPDPRDQSFFGKVFGGLGSAAGFVGGAGLGTLLGGPVGGLVAGAGLGSETAMVEGYRLAKASGADEETALKAAKYYRVIGSGEVLPVMTALKVLPHSLRITAGNKIMKHFLHIAESGGEEAVQEGMSQFLKNATDKGLYDPERGWMDGVGENALIGALVGHITGAGGTLLTGNETQPPASQQKLPVQGQGGPVGPTLPQDGESPATPAPIEPVAVSEVQPALAQPIQNDNTPVSGAGVAVTVDTPTPTVDPAAAVSPYAAAATPQRGPTQPVPSSAFIQPDEAVTEAPMGQTQQSQINPPESTYQPTEVERSATAPADVSTLFSKSFGGDATIRFRNTSDKRYQVGFGKTLSTVEWVDIGKRGDTAGSIIDAAAFEMAKRQQQTSEQRVEKETVQIEPTDIDQASQDNLLDVDLPEEGLPQLTDEITNRAGLSPLDYKAGEKFASQPSHFDLMKFSDSEVESLVDAHRQFVAETNDPKAQEALDEALARIEERVKAHIEKLTPQEQENVFSLNDVRRAKEIAKIYGSLRGAAESFTNLEAIGLSLMNDALPLQARDEKVVGVLERHAARTKSNVAVLNSEQTDTTYDDLLTWAAIDSAIRKTKSRFRTVSRGTSAKTVRDAALNRLTDDSATSEPRKTKPQPKGTLGPTFLDFSFTNRNSVFEAAFRAGGMEPDAARLLNVDQQIAKLREVLRVQFGLIVQLPTRTVDKKTITGRTVKVEREQISARDAIDQMLDAFRQLQVMTHILGLPTDAVALKKDGKPLVLSLTKKLKGALGMFSYDTEANVRTIHLPGRSNSFAHEWGHALDQWLGGYLFDGTDRQIERLLSQDILKDGMDPKATNDEHVAAAFVGLMRAMFTDKIKLAALQMSLERQAVEVNKNGKPTKAALKAQKILKDMEEGKKPPMSVVTKYFENAAEFDAAFGTDGYFQSPHEMLARAFETYIGVNAAQLSDLPGGFLNKPSWAYTGSEEERAKMTFPRNADAEQIFQAFNELASALRTREVFGPGKSEMPADNDVFDMRVWDRYQPKGSVWEREKAAWTRAKNTDRAVHQGHSAKTKAFDAVDYFASTMQGHARMIVRRQPKAAQTSLTNLLDHFMTDPGSGRKITAVWEEKVEQEAKRNTNRLDLIIKAHKLDKLNADDLNDLRRLMTVSGAKVGDANLTSAAAMLRRLLDDVWRYVDSSGIKVGYARNGWLPRIVDRNAIMDNPSGFLRQAEKLYSLMFDRDVRNEADFEIQAKDMLLLQRRLSSAERADNEGGTFRTDLFSGSDMDTLNSWRAELKAVRRRQRELDAANKDGDGDKISTAEANLEKAMEAYNDTLEDALDVLGRVFSEESARRWKARVLLGNSMDFDTKGPSNTFLKSRTLPPEADDIMLDYYQGNPLTLIQDYLQMAPRRVEYVKRAGIHSEKLENMLAKAESEGADSADLIKLRHMINLLTGREVKHDDSSVAWAGGWAYVAATVSILKWAMFSSLAEPITAGLRSGDVRDSLHALTKTLVQMTRSGDSKGRSEIARVIGLITSAEHETIMLNRFGGDIDPNRSQGKALSNFFRYTLLTQLTNIQRTAVLSTSNRIITRHIKGAIEGKKRSIEELADLGIDESSMKDMLEWLDSMGGFPTSDDLLSPDGGYFNKAAELWADANARLVQQIIQNPRRFTRPAAALDSKFRAMYGITGFVYSFHSNVLVPLFKRQIDAKRDNESTTHFAARWVGGSARNIAYVMPAIAALYMGQTLSFILRKTLQDAFKEDDDDDEAAKRILDDVLSWDGKYGFKTMLSRSGLTGAWDIPYNVYTGVKYGADMAGIYAGPHNKFWLTDVERIAQIGARNSPNTDTAERNAVKAALHMVGAAATAAIISKVPGGPLTAPLYGAAMWAIDAYGPAERFADEMYPDPKK